MLAAIITLSLISLLVATEADPSTTPGENAPGEPLRPRGQPAEPERHDSSRLAA